MTDQEQQAQQDATQEVKEELGLLDQIIDQGRLAREENQKSYAKDLISEFVGQVMEGTMTISKDTEAMINARIAQIDKLISDQLNEVMHHEDFQKLEGSWRGLHYLVSKSETGERMKIRVMNVNKKDLLKDMEKASEFDQSAMFKKIYEEEFGMFGGASYGALIGDYEFGNHPQDIALLEKMSQVAAAAHAPFLSAAGSSLFNLDSFTELGNPRDLSKIFQSAEYAKWRSFRDTEDSRYVALKCPTEIAITDRREKELADLGFVPLVHCKGTDFAAFFSTQSANKPKVYDSDDANANARMSSQIQYIMATSRFAHYLKSMMRDKLGSFMTRGEAQDFLNRWISNYTLGDPNAGQEMKAKYPLSEARVDVTEIPGKTGAYRAVAFLKPHYQLDELSVSLRLVAELPPPAGG
jgi:predicted component of type VI protein secretion system